MNKRELRADLLLLTTAIIWGASFVFQKMGADHLGAFSYNGIRFIIASIALIPVVYIFCGGTVNGMKRIIPNKGEVVAGICAGAALSFAAFFQQAGLLYTTAGKAAFITGLYMVIVPIYGLFLKQKAHMTIWIAVLFAVTGMYFLSIDQQFIIQKGDFIILVGAFFWAAHIVVVDKFNPKVNPLKFSWIQFVSAAIFSMTAAYIFERDTMTVKNIFAAGIPLLYSGICAAGVGYTLQIIGQKDAKPAPATLILSMESVFAVMAGYIALGEILGYREIAGCVLMIIGMLMAQYRELVKSAR